MTELRDELLRDASHGGKHAVQQASILGHMDRLGLLNENNVFIEFGCGKGELSNWISVAMGENSKFVLIDRRNFRQKVHPHTLSILGGICLTAMFLQWISTMRL